VPHRVGFRASPARERRRVETIRHTAERRGEGPARPRGAAQALPGRLGAERAAVFVGEVEKIAGEHRGLQFARQSARPPLTVRTTLPVFCCVSTYLVASTTSSSG